MHIKLAYILVLLFCKRAKSLSLRKAKPIIGGDESNIKDIGYLVALFDNGDFFCGGSYVKERIVVTAAHCLEFRMKYINDLTVEGGLTYLSKPSGVSSRVSKVIISKYFDSKSIDNDVALVKLKKALHGKYIQTIPLCTRKYTAGDIARVSGWGFNSLQSRRPVNQVRTILLPIMSNAKCRRIYTRVNDITKAMLCAGVLGEKDACTYDSGGPMVIDGELCGIVSFGVGCADETYPGVYTDIMYLRSFIKKSIEKLST